MNTQNEDAISTDVSEGAVKKIAVEEPLSPRDAAMREIQLEIASQNVEPEKEEVVDATPIELAGTQLDSTRVRVKVDGVEQEMSIADLKRGYQKDSVASKRLESVATRQKEQDLRDVDLTERERQIALTQQKLPDQGAEDDDGILAAFNALVEGDSEDAAKLLRDAINKGRHPATPAVDPAVIADRIKADLKAERVQEEGVNDYADFCRVNPTYAAPEPDADGNVLLTKERVRGDYLFDHLYGPKFNAGELSYRQALDETAKHVAREFTVAPAPAVNQREERKKTINNLPIAAGARVQQVVIAKTVQETLDGMRKARGQAV